MNPFNRWKMKRPVFAKRVVQFRRRENEVRYFRLTDVGDRQRPIAVIRLLAEETLSRKLSLNGPSTSKGWSHLASRPMSWVATVTDWVSTSGIIVLPFNSKAAACECLLGRQHWLCGGRPLQFFEWPNDG